MKFTSILAVVVAATVVSAETNGERLARGLHPMAPARRGTPVARGKKPTPSNSPSQCHTGSLQCCESVSKTGEGGDLDELLDLLGVAVGTGTSCGMSCSPISTVKRGSNSCKHQPVCCENNNYNGLVNIGCSPITI